LRRIKSFIVRCTLRRRESVSSTRPVRSSSILRGRCQLHRKDATTEVSYKGIWVPSQEIVPTSAREAV
jgi:hypothetical protein